MTVVKLVPDGGVTSPSGFVAAATTSGLKASGRSDLALVSSRHPCTAAGVFTRNQVVAAPVVLDQKTLAANSEAICGVVANAGNANACTGDPGMIAARQMQQAAAAALGCRPDQVLVLSTGVIGVPLPVDRIEAGLETLGSQLTVEGGAAAARAIMTTDTRAKEIAVKAALPNGVVTIGGMAKGSGMIHPNMATMLAVLTTDAAIAAAELQALLTAAVNQSFNNISVDGDTSTNDTVLLLANGQSGVSIEDEASRAEFASALESVCIDLAKMIVADGEGATKLVEIRVTGAASESDARAVAGTIATSPLVKTALTGGDPNWGRILAAAGRAGIYLAPERLGLWIGRSQEPTLRLVDRGAPTEYAETEAAAIFKEREIVICLELGQGQAETVFWTCDLTHDYITINADYRT